MFVATNPWGRWVDREHSLFFSQWHCFFALACPLVPHSGLGRLPLARALDLLPQKKNKRLLKNGEAFSLLEVGLGIKGGGRLILPALLRMIETSVIPRQTQARNTVSE